MAANCRRHSNLQSFLDSTTPFVQSRSAPTSYFQDLNTLWQPAGGKDMVEYFKLRDLWDSYSEWSAYGAGAPVRLLNGETVVQYYVPSLSGIQIYTSKALAASRSPFELLLSNCDLSDDTHLRKPASELHFNFCYFRNESEDSESEYWSWSDDSESEKLSRSWDAASGDSGFDHETSWPAKDRLGHLYFQFFESCSPFGRIPFVDKVYELARNYSGLTSFKSVELSPASWISVAWYPIYHIPARTNVKELTACFLTYHTISSSFLDQIPETVEKDACHAIPGRKGRKPKEIGNCIPLSPFGLATYKMKRNLWVHPEAGDEEKIGSLLSAADSWLKQLRVQHHDFNFFSMHSM